VWSTSFSIATADAKTREVSDQANRVLMQQVATRAGTPDIMGHLLPRLRA
jgi:hypothetical protein